ncbi:MAG: class I tRNA ligase family protein, partial [Candidatus Micrarchaeota archaeon]
MYDYKKVEEETLKFWSENRIFDKLRAKNKGKKKFRFIDGPITANNQMGVHTAYSRAVKDLYQRYSGLRGCDQRYQNGFDCHGLPVEVNIEKEEGIDVKKDIDKYGFEKFINKCRTRVDKFSEIQTQESIRMGQWMDWGNDYYTMSDENMLHIWHFLKKCHENKWIYKGHKVLPWCWRCGTSLSQHEQTDSYREAEHTSVFLQFKLNEKENEYLAVWTTTPWTLTSNIACAVNPEIIYVKAKKDGKIYYLSKATAEKALGEYEELETLGGSQLIGWEYEGPYDHLEAQKDVVHKVVEWDLVGEVDGTGIVHIAPGCGAEDNDLGKELGLAVIAPLDERGFYYKGFGEFTGKHVTKVLEPILEDLKKRGILFKTDIIKHRYPYCWRCKEDLVFRATDEWFIKMDDIKPKMIEEAEKVAWSPSYGGKLMASWLNTMSDWNISRKRYWGLPLPFWVCENEECGEFEVIGSLEELKKKAVSGIDELKDMHRPWIDKVKFKCGKCGSAMNRTPEVGDCWLDAGIVPYSTLHYLTDKEYWKEWFPAELIAEMREQVRLWFYSMLCMSVVLEGRTPYEKVIL